MPIAASILPEFDHEMATTRRILERVPESDPGWKPHPKSYALGDLAIHVATLPSWATFTLQQTDLDLAPAGGAAYSAPTFKNASDTLGMFDASVQAGRQAIESTSDADFMVPWTLKKGGQSIFTLPRIAVLRSFVLNHLIHHRGQLSVYLRLRDVPLPSVYGPTADEPI
jgi:uncharacterized damage-inducible protein DinB